MTPNIFIRLFIVMALIVHQGCAHTGPILSDYTQEEIGRIGIVVKERQEKSLQDSQTGVLSSMGKGAGRGSMLGGAGVLCMWGAIVCIPVLAAAGAVGGSVYGLYQASSETLPTDVESTLGQAITDAGLDKLLVNDLVAAAQAQGYAMEAAKKTPLPTGKNQEEESPAIQAPYDTHLEIEGPVVNLLPATFEVDPPRRVGLSTRVRIIRTADQDVLDDRIILEELGDIHSLEELTSHQAEHFREELPRASRRLSEKILMDYFMIYAFKERTFSAGAGWFFNLYVEKRVKGLWPFHYRGGRESPNAVRPTMAWEIFPGENVTYDLRIWQPKGRVGRVRNVPYHPMNPQPKLGVSEVVYSREGLSGNVHTLETLLSPTTIYIWSVRARFIQDGKVRLTEWSKVSGALTVWAKISSFGVLALAELAGGENWGFYQMRTP